MRTVGVALAILMLAAVPAAAEDKNYFIDENSGFKWLEVKNKDGKTSMELMDQELPEDRMIRIYPEMFSRHDLSPAALQAHRAEDEIDIAKQSIVVLKAPVAEAFLSNLLQGCLARVKEDIPKVPVEFRIAHKRDRLPTDTSLLLEARKSGIILVDPRLFSKTKDPRHLLFFISHEYAHVIMQHSIDPIGDVARSAADSDSSDGGMLGSIGGGLLSGFKTVGGAVSRAMGDEVGFDRRLENVAKRFQEDQADMLGADIVRGCGYGGASVTSALGTVSAWESDGPTVQSARLAAEGANQKIQLAEKSGGGTNASSDGQKESGNAFFGFLTAGSSETGDGAKSGGLFSSMTDGVEGLKEETKHEHRSGSSRTQFMNNYFAAYYKKKPSLFGGKKNSAPKTEAALYEKFIKAPETRALLKAHGE